MNELYKQDKSFFDRAVTKNEPQGGAVWAEVQLSLCRMASSAGHGIPRYTQKVVARPSAFSRDQCGFRKPVTPGKIGAEREREGKIDREIEGDK